MADDRYKSAVTNVLAQRAYGPIYSSAYADAQRSAQANEMAQRLGMPADVIEADYPNMLAEDRLQRRMAEARKNDAYARIMSNFDFAKGAIDDDDLPKVAEKASQITSFTGKARALLSSGLTNFGITAPAAGATADALLYPAALTESIGNRVGGLGAGLQRSTAAIASAVGADGYAGRLRADAARTERQTREPVSDVFTDWNEVKANPLLAPKFGFEQILSSAPDMLATLNPVGLAAYVFARAGEIGQQRAEANGQQDAALADVAIAAPFAAASSLLERFGAKGIGAGIRNPALRSVTTAATREAGTEFVQSSIEYAGGQAFTAKGMDQAEALDQALAGAVGGLFGGGIVTVAGAGIERRLQKIADRDRDTRAGTMVDALMASAATSPTRVANPSGFQQAVGELVADNDAENIYVPVEQVRALFQTEEGETEITEDPFWSRYQAQIEEAEALGGDVVIPLAEAATYLAGSPQWQQLRDHVRTRPGGASRVEAKKPARPEDLEQLAQDIHQALGQRLQTARLTEARQTVGRWAEKLGYSGPQASAVNRLLSSALATRWQGEAARAVQTGREAPTLEAFATEWLPAAGQSKKLAQNEFTMALGRVAERAKAGTLDAADASDFLDAIAAESDTPLYDVAGTDRAAGEAGEGRGGLGDGGDRPAAFADPARGSQAPTSQSSGASPQVLNQDERLFDSAQVLDDGPAAGTRPTYSQSRGRNQGGADDDIAQAGDDLNLTMEPLAQRARGSIQITPDRQGLMKAALISAYEAKNFSTAVHELGHFFLEDLRRRAVRGQATEQEQADWQTFRDWAAELGHPVGDIGPIATEAHEYFARGMERYVFEGQAPSRGLRALFFRMREFMADLYRTAMAFNAPITPEIRQVMGRMLASDEEVAEQTEALKLAGTAVGGLLSEAERAEYDALATDAREDARDKLYERVLASLRADKTAEVRERKAEIKAAVAEEVDGEPRFIALSLLRSGIPKEDGTRLKVRLPRQWLVDTYGEGALERLPRSVPPIVADPDLRTGDMFGGVEVANPDQIAALAGFANADQMVRALFDMEAERQAAKAAGDKRSPRQRLIEDETQRRLDAEMGDPFANLEEEAQTALASDRQADLMSLELRALARRTGQRPTAWAMAKAWAADRIQLEASRDALSGRTIQMHARNAGKAGAAAEEALIGGDFEAAFRAKQQQLLNMALLAESKKAKDAVDKAVRRMQRVASRDTIRSVDQDYLDQAHQLLEDVDLRERSQAAIDKRLSFERWYGAEVEAGREPVVPPDYRSLLGKTPWSRLTVAEVIELDKAVSQMVQLGRLKQRLRDGKEERDFNEAVAELEATALAGQSRTRTRDLDPNRTMLARARSRIRALDAVMIKVETLTRWLDGSEANGPWQRMIFQPMAEAQGREDDLKRQYIEQVNGLIEGLPKATLKSWEQMVDTPELIIRVPGHPNAGEPFQMTKDQVVMMAMNWGNDGNRQRLLDGFGWGENEVLAVFDRLLGKEEWDFVQGVWDTVDGLWPEIEALERRVNGVAPDKVEAAAVDTRFGSYRGGYFPAVYDPTYSTRAELDEAAKLSPNGAWFQATTRASSTKARAEMVSGRPLLLSMSVITRHLGEVIHDVTHREAVVQVRKLLRDTRVRNAIDDQLGPEYRKAMDGWLENIAQPNIADSKMNPTLVALARHLNRGISLVGLGFRLSTVLLQPLGLSNVAKEIGTARVAEGLATFVAHPAQTYREVTRRSAEMRGRFSTMDTSIEDMTAQAAGGKLRLIGPTGIAKYAFHGILYADMLVTTSGWIGAFNKGLSEGMNEDDAGLYADTVIRSTQGAGGQKDRSGILYENSFAKTFWPFFSYLNALYNQQRDVGRRARRIESAGDAFETLRQAWWVVAVPPLIQALLMGEGPDDEDKDDPESWARYLTRSVMLGNLSSLPLIGPIGNAIGSGFGYRSNAWQNIGEGASKAWKDIQADVEEGEYPAGATVKSVMTTLGILSAQPLGQPASTAQGLIDYSQGKAEPEDAGDWFELLTKGRISDKPTAAERLMGEGAEESEGAR